MLKNITLRQITLILTCFLAIVNLAILALIYFSGVSRDMSIGVWISLLAISLVLTYIVVKYFLEYFVFRKIKLIYKMISDSKKSTAAWQEGVVEDKTISEVNDEVEQWAKRRDSEIQYLTKLEDYRRNYLGNISHELKTPLFSIQGYLHTLLEGGIHDEAINIKYLRRAAANVERLQNIVEDLEMINKLESGKVSLNQESFDIKALAEEVINDLSMIAKDEEMNLKLKEGAKQSYKVTADRENIRQVLINLANNAIKYGKKDGTVKIAFYDMGDNILIEVGDDGIGIEEKHLNHLFDRFYRVEGSRNRKRGGSGLGLAIVKHIIEAHDQTINVRSTPGEGSTFSFTLLKS